MNWLKERDIITSKCENFRDYGHNDKFSKSARMKILVDNNYSCRYCGGIYPKYLICSYIPSKKCNDVCCRICYIITHLNCGFFQEVRMYYSTMSQLDIIKKTINYIIENNEIPLANKIDNNIQLPPISLIEYINILNNYDTIPECLNNYKIFFSNKMNLDFIVNNYGNKMITFVDPVKISEDTDKIKLDDTIEKHIPTQEEVDLFKLF